MLETLKRSINSTDPVVFLSYAHEDKSIARNLAEGLFDAGVEVYFDDWEIRAGDSIREKIDTGLDRCTHFIVLLTPTSVEKPWVRSEMDAAFVNKIQGQCRFIPLRHGLNAPDLPALLRGLLSPSLDDFEHDFKSLLADIYEVSKSPQSGKGRPPYDAAPSGSGLSTSAAKIARLLIEKSKNGFGLDPILNANVIKTAIDLPDVDIREGADELLEKGLVRDFPTMGEKPLGFTKLAAEDELFALYDSYFCDWDPSQDAVRIAADLLNDDLVDAAVVPDILAKRYEWEPRRLNPAIAYLVLHGALRTAQALGTAPYCCFEMWTTSKTRKFVREQGTYVSSLQILAQNRDEIIRISKRHKAFNIRVFGSTVRIEDRPHSDIDFLVDLEPQASLTDISELKRELENLLNRDVDIVDEGSLNKSIRRRVVSEARPI